MTIKSRIIEGLVSGLVAATATAGALMVFGRSLGDTLQAFRYIGLLFASPSAPVFATTTGVLLHFATLMFWGLLAGLLAPRNRGVLPVLITAVAVTLAMLLMHEFVLLPELQLGAGLGGPRAPTGPVVALHLLFAGSIAVALLVVRRGR